MKKQLESELKKLAISVLENNSETDISILKQQASNIYERLSVLAYIRNNPSATITEKTENTTISKESEISIESTQENILLELEPKKIEKEEVERAYKELKNDTHNEE